MIVLSLLNARLWYFSNPKIKNFLWTLWAFVKINTILNSKIVFRKNFTYDHIRGKFSDKVCVLLLQLYSIDCYSQVWIFCKTFSSDSPYILKRNQNRCSCICSHRASFLFDILVVNKNLRPRKDNQSAKILKR